MDRPKSSQQALPNNIAPHCFGNRGALFPLTMTTAEDVEVAVVGPYEGQSDRKARGRSTDQVNEQSSLGLGQFEQMKEEKRSCHSN
jgi:hypothetical protein